MKEQELGGTRFWARGFEISVYKWRSIVGCRNKERCRKYKYAVYD
jgi:hypothetical protein